MHTYCSLQSQGLISTAWLIGAHYDTIDCGHRFRFAISFANVHCLIHCPVLYNIYREWRRFVPQPLDEPIQMWHHFLFVSAGKPKISGNRSLQPSSQRWRRSFHLWWCSVGASSPGSTSSSQRLHPRQWVNRYSTGRPIFSYIWFGTTWILSVLLSAQFCMGFCDFGRSAWKARQDFGTPKSKSTQLRSTSSCDTL